MPDLTKKPSIGKFIKRQASRVFSGKGKEQKEAAPPMPGTSGASTSALTQGSRSGSPDPFRDPVAAPRPSAQQGPTAKLSKILAQGSQTEATKSTTSLSSMKSNKSNRSRLFSKSSAHLPPPVPRLPDAFLDSLKRPASPDKAAASQNPTKSTFYQLKNESRSTSSLRSVSSAGSSTGLLTSQSKKSLVQTPASKTKGKGKQGPSQG